MSQKLRSRTRRGVGDTVVKSISIRGRRGLVSMTMVVFVAGWGLPGPQAHEQ